MLVPNPSHVEADVGSDSPSFDPAAVLTTGGATLRGGDVRGGALIAKGGLARTVGGRFGFGKALGGVFGFALLGTSSSTVMILNDDFGRPSCRSLST